MRLREIAGRSEVLLPISITGENRGSSAFFRVAGVEVAPDDGLDGEDFEKVRRHGSNCGARRLRSSGNRRDVVAIFRNGLKAVALIAKIIEVGIRNRRPGALGIDLEDGHDPGWIGVRQRPQEHAVYDTENGGGGADGQRERKNHDGGGAGMLAELSQAVAAIGGDWRRANGQSVLREPAL